MQPTIFSHRLTTVLRPPEVLAKRKRHDAIQFWKDQFMTNENVWKGEITQEDRNMVTDIHHMTQGENRYKDLLLDRDGRDFTQVFLDDENDAAPADLVIPHLQHFLHSRNQTCTLVLVWDFESDHDDLIHYLPGGIVILDMAQSIVSRLFVKGECAELFHEGGTDAEFPNEYIQGRTNRRSLNTRSQISRRSTRHASLAPTETSRSRSYTTNCEANRHIVARSDYTYSSVSSRSGFETTCSRSHTGANGT